MGDTGCRFASFIKEVFEEWERRLRDTIKEGQAAGEISRALSAHVLAGHMVATIEGGIMLARLKKDEKPLRDALTAVRVLLRR